MEYWGLVCARLWVQNATDRGDQEEVELREVFFESGSVQLLSRWQCVSLSTPARGAPVLSLQAALPPAQGAGVAPV